MSETIGDRIAIYRRRKGMSQAQLAGLVGRSESWLGQVERGIRSVDKLSVLMDIAQLLGVDVETLSGRQWRYAPNGGTHLSSLDDIRQALTGYQHLLAEQPIAWPLPQLNAAVTAAHSAYQSAEYASTAGMLPSILTAVDAYDEISPDVQAIRCAAYTVAAKLLTKVGEAHLAWICADRAATAALGAESLSTQGMAAYQVVCALLQAERTDEAEAIAVRSAEHLMPHIDPADPEVVSQAGALWLISGVIAARRVDRTATEERLATAETLAESLGRDGNHGWSAFGPTNVAIHRASAAAEMGDPFAVLKTASLIDLESLPEGMRGRRSMLHLNLAWAQVQRRNDPEATLHLLEVERVAPELLRFHVISREMMREMLKRERKNRTPALREVATRAGVL
ncbi:helix-turn-helix domain-containing protein [Phytoactinopolyspora endophytica]|uniref:helix-turn-helix domain-containing protein n=1 Tax=Phytoactinopolyspora endophytica TaxID=1642495 RepID=UPI00101B65D6|nr:helix-turn-helix transcriptional regulator [Phytoactinopolyspora endophytica]